MIESKGWKIVTHKITDYFGYYYSTTVIEQI